MIKWIAKNYTQLEPCKWYWLGGVTSIRDAAALRTYMRDLVPSCVRRTSSAVGMNALYCAITLIPVLDTLGHEALSNALTQALDAAIKSQLRAQAWYNFWRRTAVATHAKINLLYFRRMLARTVNVCAPHIGEVRYAIIYSHAAELRHHGVVPPRWAYARD